MLTNNLMIWCFKQLYLSQVRETFASVAKLNSVKVLLSVAANKSWPLFQLDVKNTFLHGDLEKEIYIYAAYKKTSKAVNSLHEPDFNSLVELLLRSFGFYSKNRKNKETYINHYSCCPFG